MLYMFYSGTSEQSEKGEQSLKKRETIIAKLQDSEASEQTDKSDKSLKKKKLKEMYAFFSK